MNYLCCNTFYNSYTKAYNQMYSKAAKCNPGFCCNSKIYEIDLSKLYIIFTLAIRINSIDANHLKIMNDNSNMNTAEKSEPWTMSEEDIKMATFRKIGPGFLKNMTDAQIINLFFGNYVLTVDYLFFVL